jgi:hypothetical protein
MVGRGVSALRMIRAGLLLPPTALPLPPQPTKKKSAASVTALLSFRINGDYGSATTSRFRTPASERARMMVLLASSKSSCSTRFMVVTFS